MLRKDISRAPKKNAGVVVALILIFPLCGQCCPGRKLPAPNYEAVVPPDNDIGIAQNSTDKQERVPADIAALVSQQLNHAYAAFKVTADHDDNAPAKDNFCVAIYKLMAPNDAFLYIFNIAGPFGYEMSYYALRSGDGSKVTKEPISIWTKWFYGFAEEKSPLLVRPYVDFKDIHSDGHPALVVETYAHNGTLYNAAEYHYYSIGDDLSLIPLVVIEARTDMPLDVAGYEAPFFKRTVSSWSNGNITIDVELSDFADPKRTEVVGQFTVVEGRKGIPAHLLSKKTSVNDYSEALVCGAEQTADDCLAKGDTLFY